MSVVDGHLKVYGIDVLRIADGSIVLRVTSGDTMALCVVIGERVEHHQVTSRSDSLTICISYLPRQVERQVVMIGICFLYLDTHNRNRLHQPLASALSTTR